MKLKKDRYFRDRGKEAKVIKVVCSKCNNQIFIYQKDGQGSLKRCYLNRIISPKYDSNINVKDLKNLVCNCGQIIGSPFIYKDGRIAFHLVKGNFIRSNYKDKS